MLKIPALATGNDGQLCPTVRDFAVVDQDQSDNVVTTYLMTADGRTAQDSAQNAAALNGATPINNGSDNALVNKFMDPALGCTPYQFHDKTAQTGESGSQITDELLAAADQKEPIALIPLNDPMTLAGDQQSAAKTNVFRVGVDQPLLGHGPGPERVHPGELLQAHDARRHAAHPARPAAVHQLRDARRPGHRQQPVHVHGGAAVRLVRQPRLRCPAERTQPGEPDPDANGVATGATFSKLAIGTLPGGVQPSATPTDSATATPTAAPTAPRPGRRPPRPRRTPTATPTATATDT